MAKQKTEAVKHALIPKHSKLSEKDKRDLLEKYGISEAELPKILKGDNALSSLEVVPGDVIKITRKSPTAGEVMFYRVVI